MYHQLCAYYTIQEDMFFQHVDNCHKSIKHETEIHLRCKQLQHFIQTQLANVDIDRPTNYIHLKSMLGNTEFTKCSSKCFGVRHLGKKKDSNRSSAWPPCSPFQEQTGTSKRSQV